MYKEHKSIKGFSLYAVNRRIRIIGLGFFLKVFFYRDLLKV